ncbi:MAG: hypothetical protein PVF58_05865 [Candidatus Methanofastidiosia archaeon]|jgi:hypothetical protein
METSLTENEKKLLTFLGQNPYIPMKDMVNHTPYKWTSTIVKKIEQFRKQCIFAGPFYNINYDTLCKNRFRLLFCIFESDQDYDIVISYLKTIESLKTLFAVLSPHKELLNAIYLSSDTKEMEKLFQLLQDNGIINDFIIREYSQRKWIENPNFFGDFNPSLDNLLDPCDLPDLSFKQHDTDWNECDIALLPYLRMSYMNGKLMEILKAEKEQNRTWTYSQLHYSREKMIKNGLIDKKYFICPFQAPECADFNLFIKTDQPELTQRILHNFGTKARVLREYAFCGDWGYVGFESHPQFLMNIMGNLDHINEITDKELYHIRSNEKREQYYIANPPVLHYFDIDTQTLHYPYHVYRERIKEKIENEWIVV